MYVTQIRYGFRKEKKAKIQFMKNLVQRMRTAVNPLRHTFFFLAGLNSIDFYE